MAKSDVISERSLVAIDSSDLARLSQIARDDLQRFIQKAPAERAHFASALICVALCQGAALHFTNRTNGVKDFDVFMFFAVGETRPFPHRRLKAQDSAARNSAGIRMTLDTLGGALM
jgi:hypothetical protein